MSGFFCHEPLIASDSNDPDPYLTHNYCVNGGVHPIALGAGNSNPGQQTWGWWRWEPTSSYAQAAQKYTNTGVCPMQATRMAAHRDASYVPNSLVGHPASGKNPLLPVYWNHSIVRGNVLKGQSTFMKWIGTPVLTWDTLSIVTPKDYLAIGDVTNAYVVVPWSGATPNT
jgi:hypothetical protein